MLPSYRKACWHSVQFGPFGRRGCGPRSPSSPVPSLRFAPRPLPKPTFALDSTLVLIPVTVTDPMNRFVTGLEKENFKILEDHKEQDLTQFSSEDAPLSVGVVFDCSGSMGSKLDKSRQAVAQFFKTANPGGRVLPGGVPRLRRVGPSRSPPASRRFRTSSPSRSPKAEPPLLDAIYLSLHEMKKARNPRKAAAG